VTYPRTISVSLDDNMKFKILFLKNGEVKWTVQSYVITGVLPLQVSEWLEKEIHPVYGYS